MDIVIVILKNFPFRAIFGNHGCILGYFFGKVVIKKTLRLDGLHKCT